MEAHEVGAEGEFNRLIKTFEKDGILSAVKKNLVGFVSDSAGVLQGDRSGVAVRLQEYFEPIVYSIRKTSSKKFSVLLPDLPPSLM